MAKQQLIIEAGGEDKFEVYPSSSLTVSSGQEVKESSGLWARPGEKLEIVVTAKLGEGIDLWLFARGHDIAALEPEDFVHQGSPSTLRVELKAQTTTTVIVNRSPLGPSEAREYYVEACKRGAPEPMPPSGEGQAGTLNTSPG